MRNIMKNIILLSSFLFSLKSFSQINANPGVAGMKVTELANIQVDENNLPLGTIYRLKIPISNGSASGIIPSGSCKIKIGLGSKIALSVPFNLSTAEASQYFDWSENSASGQIQIIGDLKNPLPENFRDTLSFDVVGISPGLSTVTTNFLVTNHNTTVILSDEDGSNNYTFLGYNIVPAAPIPAPVPVTFTNLSAVKNKCDITVLFGAENEINVKKFQIEISKNGFQFIKVGELDAKSSINYSCSFNINALNAAKNMYYRVKSLDNDGRFQYSPTKVINGLCDESLAVVVFPNPVNEQSFISVKATKGLFNGIYNVNMYDVAGKLLSTNKFQLLDAPTFNFPLTKIAGGQYLLKIANQANADETFKVMIQKK